METVAVVNPKTPPIPKTFYYIDLESVESGILVKDNIVSSDDAPSRAQRVLQINDILYQTVRPYQKNNYIFEAEREIPTVASTGYAQIRTAENPHFFYELFHTPRFVSNVLLRCTGTSYPAVSGSDLNDIKVVYPNRIEQQKIAAFVQLLEKRIDAQRRLLENLKSYKRGLSEAFFTQTIQFPLFNNDEWKSYRLGDLGYFYNGLSGKSKKDFGSGNARYIPYMNVFSNPIADIDSCDLVSVSENEKQNRVRFGDLLFTQSSETLEEVGYSSVWEGITEPYLNSFCFGFRFFNISNVDLIFIAHYFRSSSIRNAIMHEGQGATRVNLSAERLKNMTIRLPSVSVQKNIGAKIQHIQCRTASAERLLSALEKMKKGLLQQLFI